MKVWIDQSYCTGDGLCEDLCPEVFKMGDDGLAHVVDGDGMAEDLAKVEVPGPFGPAVMDAQAQCAGECIYTEN